MNPVRQFFSAKHGTERGYVRHCLALLEYYGGTVESFSRIDWNAVDRLVFVCLGNICRSAFAHQFMLDQRRDIEVVSIGLSTTTGVGANEQAIATASDRGVDMTSHRAVDLSGFEVRSGDLFLAMEIRQARRLNEYLKGTEFEGLERLQIGLLGVLCSPPRPHLHDPYSLSPEYFNTCFSHIEDAVLNLANRFPAREKS